MKIAIGGDFVVTDRLASNYSVPENLCEVFQACDFRILNFEAPVDLQKGNARIWKTGPHLKMSPVFAKGIIEDLGVNAVTLANNHINDFGEIGIKDTLEFLENIDVKTVGTGSSLDQAKIGLTLNKEGLYVCILNFCEEEWSIATNNSFGSNPLDAIENSRQIKAAKQDNDLVICVLHGGNEYYNLPSPEMKSFCHFLVESGADAVICHHSHCISGFEIYRHAPIFYGIGNFLFTMDSKYPAWYTGMVVELNCSKEGIKAVYHFVQQSREDFKLTLLAEKEKESLESEILKMNEIITSDSSLLVKYEEFVSKSHAKYEKFWSPFTFLPIAFVGRVLKFVGLRGFNKYGLSLYLNLIRCKSHREVSIAVLKNYLSKFDK